MTDLSNEERARRNAAYMKKIFCTEDLTEAAKGLESAMGGGNGPRLQVAKTEERSALESLQVMVKDPTGKDLNANDHIQLEAIVHKVGRPAYQIKGNSFNANGIWSFLKTDDVVRQRVEQAIKAVGRVELPTSSFSPYAGTGFLVGDRTIMTNRHVATMFTDGIGTKKLRYVPGTAGVDFRREVPGEDQPTPIMLDVDEVVMIHPYWDMALLKLRQDIPKEQPRLQLSTVAPEDLKGNDLVSIGYPAFDDRNDAKVQNKIFNYLYEVKRLMPGKHNGATKYGGQPTMAHDSSTLGGASGSAVVDITTGDVVGLHYAGVYMESNYAVPTIRLAEDPRVVDLGVQFSGTRDPDDRTYAEYWEKADAGEVIRIRLDNELDEAEILGNPARDVTPYLGKFDVSSLEATRFSWTTALSTALASYVVYESEDVIKETCRTWGLENCAFIEWDNTECFIAGNSDTALVAFRGTEKTIADWITDLNAIGTTQLYGRVHRGFRSSFLLVAEKIDEALQELGSPEIVLTGHSLGGAQAVIAAAEWFGKHKVRSMYTFGQPAVGRGHFPQYMRERYGNVFHRFVNDDDIVPKVPPYFRHTGKLYHFGPGDDLRPKNESVFGVQETATMTPEEFDELRRELLRKRIASETGQLGAQEGWLPSFRDHAMARYIAKIAASAGD
ncbi:MAG: hypothetical protein Aurels2KO_39490 [Aureliella sp.]